MKMIKSFLISMFAVFLFALGAAGSWFYLSMDKKDEGTDEFSAAASTTDDSQVDPYPSPTADAIGSLPAVVRGPELDAEEMFRLSTATAAKREQLRLYEDRLREHKLRIKAADADTKAAQREVEGALSEVRNIMDGAEKLLGDIQLAVEELKKQKTEATKKAEELKVIEDEVGAGAAANVKTFAEYMQSMPATDAANAIKEMINDGKIDFAIQLLRKIEPRNVSKILAEIKDATLVAELAARYPKAPVTR